MTIPSFVNGAIGLAIDKKTTHEVKVLKSIVPEPKSLPNIDIIDIRHDSVLINLKDEILKSLRPSKGPKTLPTLLLYDKRGLQLFEKITYLDEYYLTNAEIDVLKRHASDIAKAIPAGSMVVELGSGNLRKVSILLQALDASCKEIDYYALDLSMDELSRTLEQVPEFKYVKCHGLHGTYDDGLEWLKLPENSSKTKCIMSLGSSIGNFSRPGAGEFLKGFADILSPSDSILIGLDATSDSSKVYHAYNDREGVTHRFISNGLVHANHLLGEQVFNPNDWEVIGEYVHDSTGSRHQASYAPKHNVQYKDIFFRAEERVKIEDSLKYSAEDAVKLWEVAGLQETNHWTSSSDNYSIHFLVKDKMAFHTNPTVYAKSTIPTLGEWEGLWKAWDIVTRGMIPEEFLLEKPIKLRNACIFYLGHIPTFMDIQLNKVTKEPPCEPSHYQEIFERGIDPDVDNPDHCHAHSDIPDEWPPLEEIIQYQTAVRNKIRKFCKSSYISRDIGRALWMGFEHEIMHLETLLYMLLQSDRTLPPTIVRPDFEGNAKLAEKARVPNEWFNIPKQTIILGLEDPEDNSKGDLHFGWDNEKPQRKVTVPAFQAQGRAITNGEYAVYLEQSDNPEIPVSWSEDGPDNLHTNGYTNGYSKGHNITASKKPFLEGKFVRTVYGLVPLKYALDWPVFASYDELLGCANFMGGRIPTVEEAQSIYSHVDGLRREEAERHLGKTVPAVNGHLLHDGVEESPPYHPSQNGESSQELFTDLKGANVGFKNWHPIAITASGNKLAGQSEMGGVWEWTSSPLEKHDGFEPMSLYPAYTADFFDGKHNIVLGGSWATHPRIAGRRTFVNWFQRNYLYAWVGARLVRDL